MQPPYLPIPKAAPQTDCLASARFPSPSSRRLLEQNARNNSWLRRLLSFAFMAVIVFGASTLQAQTTPTLAVSLSPVTPEYTDTVTVTANLTGTGATQPTGTITYSVDGGSSATATLTQAATNSVAYFPIPPQTPGAHSVSVSYSGDGNYKAISAQSQPFAAADRTMQLNGSQTHFEPVSLALTNTYPFVGGHLGGVALDAELNVYLSFEPEGGTNSEIGEVTGFGFNFQTIPVTGLGLGARLAVDTAGNLYIADPANARVVKYSSAGVQTNLPLTGLTAPTYVTYDPGSGSLFILDSTLGGVIQFNLSSQMQTTVFSGVTGLEPALAVDGVGGMYYAVGQTVMFRGSGGTVSPIYGEFNGNNAGDPDSAISGLTFDPIRQSLFVSAGNGAGCCDLAVRLDALHHASYVGGLNNVGGQTAVDKFGNVYGPRGILTNNPVAANVGNLDGDAGKESAVLQLPYGHAETTSTATTTPGVYLSAAVVGTDFYTDFGYDSIVLVGPGSYPVYANFKDGSQTIINTFGTEYQEWLISDPGTVTALTTTPFGQPAGLAFATPVGSGATILYVSDKASNTVVSRGKVVGFTGLVSPSQLAADGAQDVWVLDQGASSGGARVVRLDHTGTQTVPYTAATGDQLGLIQNVSAFTVDGAEDIYLGGSQNSKGVIVRIDPLGMETELISGIGVPSVMATGALNSVYTLDSTGTLLKIDQLGNQTTIATGLPAATEISLDGSGTIYLSSTAGTGVLTIAPDGTQRNIVVPGVANPALALVEQYGGIYVTDGVTKNAYMDQRYDTTVNFGTVGLNTTASLDYTVSDIGNVPLGALTPSVNQTGYAPFSEKTGISNGCQFGTSASTRVQPGQTCHILFQYAPTKAETDTATAYLEATVSDNSLTGEGWNLTGTGSTTTAAPVPALTPPSLEFGSLAVGTTSASQVATLSNSGTLTLTVSSIAITGADTGSFTETNTCGSSVAASASCTITIACKPSAAGALTASLTATYPSPLTPQTVALTCTGTSSVAPPAPAPQAALTPATQDFGSVTVGSSSAAKTFTLTNAGTATLPITSVAITGSNASAFTLGMNGCGSTLAAGAACTVNISFSPAAAGSEATTLTVIDSIGTQTSALTGTGVAAAVAVPDFAIAATPPTQIVAAGSSADYTVNITPASGFNSAVALTATGLPPGASVTFTPASVTPGSAGVSSAMVIHTTTQTAMLKTSPEWKYAGTALAAVFFLLPLRRLRRWRAMLCALLFSTTLVVLGGCGGGFGLARPAPAATTYTVTVTGTSASLTHSTTVQITVQAAAATVAE